MKEIVLTTPQVYFIKDLLKAAFPGLKEQPVTHASVALENENITSLAYRSVFFAVYALIDTTRCSKRDYLERVASELELVVNYYIADSVSPGSYLLKDSVSVAIVNSKKSPDIQIRDLLHALVSHIAHRILSQIPHSFPRTLREEIANEAAAHLLRLWQPSYLQG